MTKALMATTMTIIFPIAFTVWVVQDINKTTKIPAIVGMLIVWIVECIGIAILWSRV